MIDLDIQGRVQDLLSRYFYDSQADISLGTRIGKDLGADSLDLTELQMQLEEEFNVMLTVEESQELITQDTTVHDWVNCLKEKV